MNIKMRDALLGETITIIGSVLCNRTTSKVQWYQSCESGTTGQGYYCWNNVRCRRAKQLGLPKEQQCLSGDHTPVVYAVEGTPEIESTLNDLVEQYFPEEGMNSEQSQLFLDKYTEKLKYFISGPYDIVREIHNITERFSMYMTLTGKIYEKDGVKWFEVSSYTSPGQESDFIPNFPGRMLQPDKPLVPITEEPIFLKVTHAQKLKCICIPAGSYMQGSGFYERRFQDEYPHKVTLTKSFYISEIPVTQDLFVPLIGKNPSVNKGARYPVENAYYSDILKFCEILSEMNRVTVRLPTAAEWEYAARVGTSNPCFKPKYLDQTSRYAQPYSTNNPNAWGLYDPQPVMCYNPNGWGLYDMISYAWHITSDYFDANARVEEVDPTGPPLSSRTMFSNDFGPIHRSKGGFYYRDCRPAGHGTA